MEIINKLKVILAKAHHSLCLVTQSCPTLCNPMDSSPPGSSIHGILQATILEWAAVPSSRGSSQPRDRTRVSCIAGRFFKGEPPRSPLQRLFAQMASRKTWPMTAQRGPTALPSATSFLRPLGGMGEERRRSLVELERPQEPPGLQASLVAPADVRGSSVMHLWYGVWFHLKKDCSAEKRWKTTVFDAASQATVAKCFLRSVLCWFRSTSNLLALYPCLSLSSSLSPVNSAALTHHTDPLSVQHHPALYGMLTALGSICINSFLQPLSFELLLSSRHCLFAGDYKWAKSKGPCPQGSLPSPLWDPLRAGSFL